MTIRRLFPLLAVAVVAVASSPADVAGQISSCWVCVKSIFQPDNNSTICQGWYSGTEHCAQAGSPDFHLCLDYGGPCDDGVFAAGDDVAVESVLAGQMLPVDGGHFVMTERDDIVIMRKCGAVIARFAMSELKSGGDHAAPLAVGPMETSDRREKPVAAAYPRRGIL